MHIAMVQYRHGLTMMLWHQQEMFARVQWSLLVIECTAMVPDHNCGQSICRLLFLAAS